MTRIFSDYAYGNGPRSGCWWDETCELPVYPELETNLKCDVAIIGAGFTGLNAALHLSEAGVDVVVVDTNHIGWGASGRNGGFCCLGGSMASDALLDRRFGRDGRLAYRNAEKTAVIEVQDLIERLDLNVDKHSNGETELAHRARDVRELENAAAKIHENYGVTPEFLGKAQLSAAGLSGPFHAALTTPIGFALNPRKYVVGLANAATLAGARIFSQTPVTAINGTTLKTSMGTIKAQNIIIATNGYSSDDMPKWLSARYMPVQSNVLVTRPLTKQEQQAQGWTTAQMAYDTRNLLHYFRLMPDGRFLFGMRGGLFSSPASEARAREKVCRDFREMFPGWADIEVTNSWSGMVCIARNQLPFIGPLPDHTGVFAALCYHGNGVAMGSYSGKKLAEMILGKPDQNLPLALQQPLAKFPFGRARRLPMPAIYAGYSLSDV